MDTIKAFREKDYGLFIDTYMCQSIIGIDKNNGNVFFIDGGFVEPIDILRFNIQSKKLYFTYLGISQYLGNIDNELLNEANAWIEKANNIIKVKK